MDGLFARWGPWPYQTFLPRHPEPAEEHEPDDERMPGLIDESN